MKWYFLVRVIPLERNLQWPSHVKYDIQFLQQINVLFLEKLYFWMNLLHSMLFSWKNIPFLLYFLEQWKKVFGNEWTSTKHVFIFPYSLPYFWCNPALWSNMAEDELVRKEINMALFRSLKHARNVDQTYLNSTLPWNTEQHLYFTPI